MSPQEPGQFKSPSFGLVLVRIAVGFVLVFAGWTKISMGVSEDLVLGTRPAFEAAPGFIRTWGEAVVLPHPKIFANLIAWGELLGGLALFLGALTRPAGILLAFQFANFFFVGPDDARPFEIVLIAACLGCAISRAGRSWGADVVFDQKLPRWVIW